ncbi:polysaccharide deacetylase family protein [Gilvimarinus xylanilyticus]|uniref:Polysaccharide deacetylase family protein n=1 Tax=Gilvimarinus xylanilyticus TaxID=2944139 RepID=A0A9X2HW54_9GAMM|nr:polysaccharide deacetylase family protein [Gilvimarinus xylanilyticus]MCP8899508.1 polysaccharide deacetylase family protein [Gilvimarinus xylanilyticus]
MRLLQNSLLSLCFTLAMPLAAAEGPWQGKRAAVALTYDDSLNVHLDTVIPALNELELKGTFYLTIAADGFSQRMAEWRAAAADGHELGNHTLFHPCNGQGPGREWVAAERDLSTWTLGRILGNIEVANTTLQALDGKTERTFAYPCGDTLAGGESYLEAIKPLFAGARGVAPGFPSPDNAERFNLAAHVINGQSIEQLKALVDNAIAQQGLLVFLFHGVGGEHPLNLEADTHAQLLDYLHAQQHQLWVAPMVDIASALAGE